MRSDGRRIKTLDPMFAIIPHLMPQRYDSQVMSETEINYTLIRKYISQKAKEGIDIGFMSVFLAAYLRTICNVPELNRFVINKNVYARKEFWASFIVLKKGEIADDKIETVAKIKLEFTDTIFDVAKKVEKAIEENRKVISENISDKLAKFFMGVPLLSRGLITFLKGCDKIGLMHKAIIEGSPFHTSIFITNMASIKMGTVHHHIYDFGTTSIFVSMGRMQHKVKSEGKKEMVIPIGVVVDERICAGVTFAKAYGHLKKYLEDPRLLETPPRKVIQDIK